MSTSSNKLIDIYQRRDQKVIIGYLSGLNESNDNIRIPTIIAFKCLLFYSIREHLTRAGNKMSLSEYIGDKPIVIRRKDQKPKYNVVSMKKTGANTVYGAVKIKANENYIYKWHIKIIATNYQWFAFSIGIDSSHRELVQEDFSVSGMYGNVHQFYAWGTDGKNGKKFTGSLPPIGKRYGDRVKLNDTITMSVDMKKQSIEYFINNKSQGIAFDNIHVDMDYHMAISMRGIGRIKLVQFQQTFCN